MINPRWRTAPNAEVRQLPARPSRRAEFRYGIFGPIVALVDLGGAKSITNDAERVVEDLVRDGVALEGKRLIYRDQRGHWDELLVVDGRFRDFRILQESDLEELIRMHPGFTIEKRLPRLSRN